LLVKSKKKFFLKKKIKKNRQKVWLEIKSILLLCHNLNPNTMNKFLAMLMMSATLFVVACNNATEETPAEEATTEEMPVEDAAPSTDSAAADTTAAAQ